MKPAKKATLAKVILATGFGFASLTASAAVTVPSYNIEAGKVIAEANCAACHGANGVSAKAEPMPTKATKTKTRYFFMVLLP